MEEPSSIKPRIGVPYRTRNEELNGQREKYSNYLRSIEVAGGTPVEISLGLSPEQIHSTAHSLDGIVLPGSPADIEPARYGSKRHPECENPDPDREKTDTELLATAFSEGKPVLAICYGVQLLNVYLGGTLVQDVPSEIPAALRHSKDGLAKGNPDPVHRISVLPGSKLAKLVPSKEALVNSSHHQAIRELGRGLRVVAKADDGVAEAIEWTGDSNWVIGVQWHPERMTKDSFSQALFRELIAASRSVAVRG